MNRKKKYQWYWFINFIYNFRSDNTNAIVKLSGGSKLQGFWVVHDEIVGFHEHAIINAAKFVFHDTEIEAVGVNAV